MRRSLAFLIAADAPSSLQHRRGRRWTSTSSTSKAGTPCYSWALGGVVPHRHRQRWRSSMRDGDRIMAAVKDAGPVRSTTS